MSEVSGPSGQGRCVRCGKTLPPVETVEEMASSIVRAGWLTVTPLGGFLVLCLTCQKIMEEQRDAVEREMDESGNEQV